jgi:hypothetical protein
MGREMIGMYECSKIFDTVIADAESSLLFSISLAYWDGSWYFVS